jgi:transposase
MLAVVVRREHEGKTEYEKRKFGATKAELGHALAWLQHHKVNEVVMESTAQYWRPVWYALELHFRLTLCHPLKVRAPRGRKRDYRDAQRLADRWRSGDLEASFVPGAQQREWRELTRMRVHVKKMIGIIRNRVEGLLEHGGYKLTAVVSDPFGVSGWAMLRLIAAGSTDTDAMVALAKGVLRKKEAQLREALNGHLDGAYRLMLRQHMDQVTLLRTQLDELNAAITSAMKEHLEVLVRLTKVPGIDLAAAQELLAEIGPGAAAFPSPEQFASWIGVCPGSNESAGVVYSRRSAKGNRYLRRLLCQIAWAAIRTKDTFFAAFFARKKPKLESKGAAWATAHKIAGVVWLLMHQGVEYKEQGRAPLNERTLMRRLRRLKTEFTRAGLDLNTFLPAQIEVRA